MPRNSPSKLRDRGLKIKRCASGEVPLLSTLAIIEKMAKRVAAFGLKGLAVVKRKYRNTFIAAALLYILCWYPEWCWG